MEQKKLQSCYNFMYTSLAFSKYLNEEMYITSRIYKIPTTFCLNIFKRESYIYTLITHSILLLSVFKEELLKKDEQDILNLYISENTLDSLLGNLTQPDGTKYKIGSLTVNDKKEVLELLRNKLLHGDFYVEGNSIHLVKEGITGAIKISELIRTCLLLVRITDYKLNGTNTRPMVLCKNTVIESKERLDTDKDLKRLMQNTYFVEFYDEPEKDYERTPDYVLTLQKFYEDLHQRNDLIKQHTFKNTIDLLMHEYKDKFKKNHIKLTYAIKPVSQTTEYPKIKQFFISNKHEFDDMSLVEKRLFMVLASTNILEHQNSTSLKTTTALYNNMKALDAYLNGYNPEQVVYNMQQSITYSDDMTIAALFNAFYSMYHYGLDEIYSKGSSSTALREIANGTYLNFAKLNLNDYYDPSMTIEATFKDFPNHLLGIKKDVIEAQNKLNKAEDNKRNYLTKAKVQTPEKIAELEQAIVDATKLYNEALEVEKNAEDFMDKDYDRYVMNFNIISHIRNSFAHGNVKMLPYVVGDPLLDQEILMQDIFKGNCTYTLRIKFRDLYNLIEEKNAEIMLDFINEKLGKTKKKETHTHKLS